MKHEIYKCLFDVREAISDIESFISDKEYDRFQKCDCRWRQYNYRMVKH